jgi:polysaccharide pyruvyl transferase WcaK-like protein/glycosyltransferase involved in cell wall biosynthesis
VNAPTLSIGLPVYNGERYLAEALDALLAQTYTDFELIISDNASTDRTAEICRDYAARDDRIRYLRQPVNIGAQPNHNATLDLARGRYFKWASHDDLYAPDLLRRCVEVLETRPEVVLAHSLDAMIDENGAIIHQAPYPLRTDGPDPAVRLRSLLRTPGGNDFYGVVRTEVFRHIGGQGSYHNSDRTFVAAVSLYGPFHQVPEVLYYRRDHPDRGERARSHRARVVIGNPKLANRLRHPMVTLYAAYLLGYVGAILHAPLSPGEKVRCLREWLGWLTRRAAPGQQRRLPQSSDPAVLARQAGTRRTLRVAAVGYLGIGNLGNEALLTALHAWLRSEHPEVELSAIAVGPREVTRDHGIPAVRLMTYRRDLDHGGLGLAALKALGRLRDIPHLFACVRKVDTVVVPGSGVLESGLGIPPWGLPYWLFVTALACRLQRRRFALVSVGAQYPDHPATRFFYRWTLRLASWVSVRDSCSAEAVQRLGVRRRVAVYPDLVFSSPTPSARPGRPGDVAVGVMAYYGSPGSSLRGPAARAAYTAGVTRLVERLAAGKRTVTLIVGDEADREVAREVAARVARPDLVTISTATDLDGIMRDIADTEVVVAARFHNLIAGLKMGKPTVSLGYARKAEDLLSRFGLGGLSQPMDDFDIDLLVTQLDKARGVDDFAERSQEELERCRRELAEQFDVLSVEVLGRP